MECAIEKYSNSLWGKAIKPLVSVVICLYNRPDSIVRAIQSIENQSLKDLELIVVDNGSTVMVEDIVKEYLPIASLPMLFIKREWGLGPMTGRNTGIKCARGKYIALLDDDDEYLPDALNTLVDEWDNIPENQRHEYREVVGLCQDQSGELIGTYFPIGINNMSWRKALKECKKTGSAHIALNRSDILKSVPFEEPEGVTLVSEAILWEQLAVKYKSWFVNKIVYKYYLDSIDSYCHTAKKKNPKQIVINGLYDSKYRVEHFKELGMSPIQLSLAALKYDLFSIVLKKRYGGIPQYSWSIDLPKGKINRAFIQIMYMPAYFLSFFYVQRL